MLCLLSYPLVLVLNVYVGAYASDFMLKVLQYFLCNVDK